MYLQTSMNTYLSTINVSNVLAKCLERLKIQEVQEIKFRLWININIVENLIRIIQRVFFGILKTLIIFI